MEVYQRTNPPIAPPHRHTGPQSHALLWFIGCLSIASMVFVGFVLWMMQASAPAQQSTAVYKTVRLQNAENGYMTFEIPSTWSVFNFPENVGVSGLPAQPTAAVGQTDVGLGDLNWSQVDFYYVYDDIIDQLTRVSKTKTPHRWSQTSVGGIRADVYTAERKGDEVTKENPGGQELYLRLPGGLKTLKIVQQSHGDTDFQDGFKHMMKTMQFSL